MYTVWLGGDRYALYNDQSRSKKQKWSDLTSSSIRENVYVLLYVHLGDGPPGVVDGTEETLTLATERLVRLVDAPRTLELLPPLQPAPLSWQLPLRKRPVSLSPFTNATITTNTISNYC